jgi:hypothetical protein
MCPVLGALVLGCSNASNESSTHALGASPKAVVASATPDPLTLAYVALVHSYWLQYKDAESNGAGSRPAQYVCFGGPGSAYPQFIDPSKCRERAIAILAVHQKFLRDRTLRNQLPKAIADVEGMISAAGTGSKDAVLQATQVYVDDMIPTVTDALDDVDPSVLHN